MIRISMIRLAGRTLSTLELVGIFLALFMAFAFQILLHELPCPLCLLQRLGFLGIAFGLLLNLRFGLRPSHYSIVIISALFTSFVALRQIALHIVPGTGAYGSAIFGLHLYTWSFIVAMLIVVVTTVVLGVERQYKATSASKKISSPWLTHGLFSVITLLIIANIVSVLLQCGLVQCPDNPVHYFWWW